MHADDWSIKFLERLRTILKRAPYSLPRFSSLAILPRQTKECPLFPIANFIAADHLISRSHS